MQKELYSEYIDFLIQHNLFDKGIFQYFKKNLVFIPHETIDEYHSIGCTIILNRNEKLVGFIPCVPYLENDKTIAINIFVYVQALMLLPNIGKVYDERDYDYTLPFSFQKLYILKTKNISLLEYNEKMILHQFQEKDLTYQKNLIESYCQNKKNLDSSANKVKRKAKNCFYSKVYNK